MNATELERLLEAVRAGAVPVADAARRLCAVPASADLGFATIDHHRELRQGHPEIVYAPGKTPAQVAAIAAGIAGRSGRVLVTRADAAQAAAVVSALPDAEYREVSGTIARLPPGRALRDGVAIVSAGTADQAAAEETDVVCRYLGERAMVFRDVGVAGLHRLMAHAAELRRARVVIAVAGMEGALASVVGGLVGVPVVALPTSVGYGTGAGGVAALLSMLNSCAANVCTVNIDDGVGAAVVAHLINAAGRESQPRG
jgi:NCAIR mutase (PurE)-related protein